MGQARKSHQLVPSWFLDIFEVISLYRLKNQHEAAPQLMSISVGPTRGRTLWWGGTEELHDRGIAGCNN